MGGKPSSPPPEPPPAPKEDQTAVMMQQQAMQSQAQQAAAAAQLQAQIAAQNQAGQEAMARGAAQARETLSGMNLGRQIQDQANLAVQQKAGAAATGGGFGMAQPQQTAIAGMGAAPTMTTAAAMSNQGTGGTQQLANQYSMPAGLTFGGA